MSTRVNEIGYITRLRAIAPLLVIWAHFGGWWMDANEKNWWILDTVREYVTGPLALHQDGGHLGVMIFFLISGFIISHTALRENLTSFALKRSLRIFPALVVATALMWGTQKLASGIGIGPLLGQSAVSGWEYAASLILLPSNPQAIVVTWSLFPELVFYGMVLCVICILKTRPLVSTLILSLMALGISQSYRLFPGADPYGHSLAYLPLFVLGRTIYLMKTKAIHYLPAAGLLLTGMLSLYYAATTIAPEMLPSVWSSYAIAILVFVAATFIPERPVGKITKFLSNISYSLYLLHVPVGIFTLTALTRLGFDLTISVALAILLSTCVSWLCYKWVERSSQGLARKWADGIANGNLLKSTRFV